jgi:hypothetical protein
MVGQSKICNLNEIGIHSYDINYLPGTLLKTVHQGTWIVSCYEGMSIAVNEATRIIDTLFISFNVDTKIKDTSDGNSMTYACFWKEKFETLSLVGSYISYEFDYDNDCGGPYPHYGGYYRTIELGTHRLVSINEIFPEASILKGLLRNESILHHLINKKPKSLSELRFFGGQLPDTVGKEGRINFDSLLYSFCFSKIIDNKVTVIFGLNEEVASSRGGVTSFEIQLAIPANKRDMFLLANKNRTLFDETK